MSRDLLRAARGRTMALALEPNPEVNGEPQRLQIYIFFLYIRTNLPRLICQPLSSELLASLFATRKGDVLESLELLAIGILGKTIT